MKAHALWLFPLIAFFAGWALHPGPNPPAASATSLVPATTPAKSASAPGAPSGSVASPDAIREPPPVSFPAHLTAKEVFQLPGELHRLAAFSEFLKTASTGELAALYREWLPFWRKYESYWPLLFERWVELDPQDAVHTVMALGGHQIYEMMYAWADRDPQAALAWMNLHAGESQFSESSDLRAKMLAVILPKLVPSSPQDLALPKPGQLPPLEAIQRIAQICGPLKSDSVYAGAIAGVFSEWAKKDPAAAWQAALHTPELTDMARSAALRTMLPMVLDTDPALARQWFDALPSGSLRNDVAAEFAWSLKPKGPAAIRDFALSLPEDGGRQNALKFAAEEAVRTDPDGFGSFLAGLPAGDTADFGPLRDAMASWMLANPAEAGAFVKAHTPPDLQATDAQHQIYYTIFSRWSDKDPQACTEFLLQMPVSVGTPIITSTVRRMFVNNPAKTADWLADKTDSPYRDAIFATVSENWTKSDVTGATNWLNTLAPGPARSIAIETFAQQIVSTNPDEAAAWLRTIPDSADRLRRLNSVWQKWLDRDAAVRWRDTSPDLTPTERTALGGK